MKNFAKAMILCIAACTGVAQTARAQEYPSKPVRFIVGFAAGANDAVARIVAKGLSDSWGQNVLVENRPGAGGTIGADAVAKAAPDGYTLFVGEFGPNIVASSLFSKLPYDPENDFAHVTQLVSFPLVLVVPAGSPSANLQDFIREAKAKPGMLKYSTGGIGASPHLFLAMLNMMARIDAISVHYRGGGPALAALLGGEVDYTMLSAATAVPQIMSGRIRAIAVTGATAMPRLPNVPTVASVLPGYEAIAVHGLHAPAKTPAAIVRKIHQQVREVLQRPEVKTRFAELAMDVSGSSPEEFTTFIRQQIKTWAVVAREANVRAD